MPQRDLVVIGASAGGVTALQQLIHELPADFPAAILIVLHISRESSGLLPDVLVHAGRLPARNATYDEPIRNGHIYVAPPNRHLLVGPGRRIQIGHGPKENRFRPAVDPLFRSAALHGGANVIGIILSGGLDDGTAGLCAIKRAGGLSVVQSPEDAEVRSMPVSALQHVGADFFASAGEIGKQLPRLLTDPIVQAAPVSEETKIEVALAADERNRADVMMLGDPSPYTCPTCRGTLMRIHNATPERYRCHTGHAFTAMSLDEELRESVENAVWNVIRALQEHAMLLNEMVRRPGLGNQQIADYRERADAALKRAQALRDMLNSGSTSPPTD